MSPQALIELLLANQLKFMTGVPDSVFKDFIIAVNQDSRFDHVITNNEGESCALAAGYHLATGHVPVVYLQNSGLGNAINPLTSLLDAYIYSIPALLLIGWRAAPGEKDEPQHKRMGEITRELLNLLAIPHAVVDSDLNVMQGIFQQAQRHFATHQSPFAILFPRDAIQSDSTAVSDEMPDQAFLREQLLEILLKQSSDETVFVTTTGKTSRELYEIRERHRQPHGADFLTVGSMGCAATIALGIARYQPNRRVVLVDGDGACLMRMEALATIGHLQPKNLLHVLVDNHCHESTGAQPTLSSAVDFPMVAKACGYRDAKRLDSKHAFEQALVDFPVGPTMLSVECFPYSRSDLGRPKTTPLENKEAFMQELGVLSCKPLS